MRKLLTSGKVGLRQAMSLLLIFVLLFSALSFSSCQKNNGDNIPDGTVFVVDPLTLPAFSGNPFIAVNDNKPVFDENELKDVGYEKYSELDALGRCGAALASCGIETMPGKDEERGSISNVTPSGWVQVKYDTSIVSGGYLYNRCHLIGWQLSAENANDKNIITGTKYLNINGMLPFENMIADYIKETKNHVAYRVTPIFVGNELVCRGVQLEAYSIEDNGEGICFNIYCYNVQPGVAINYATGNSCLGDVPPSETNDCVAGETYILNTNSKKIHDPSCSLVDKISENNKTVYEGPLNDLLEDGYTFCGHCSGNSGETDDTEIADSTQSHESAESPDETENSPVGESYVLNTKTKTAHKPGCSAAERIDEANRVDYVGNIQDLVDEGYKACGICLK